jgi:hypothetical protein
MSQLLSPFPVFIFGSFLYRSDLFQTIDIEEIWNSKFGKSIEFFHNYFPMKDYYSKEMGTPDLLSRIIFVSPVPASRDGLTSLKLWSDSVEKSNSKPNGNRLLNLDIGYISLENVVLATGKSFSHRVHLQSGVYADLTYFYEDKTFKAFTWTYPDYSHVEFVDFFNYMRSILQKKISNRTQK